MLLLLACAGEDGPGGDGGLGYSDFVPEPGWIAEYIPQDAPEVEPMHLHIGDEGGWQLRRGERWADAEVLGDWEALDEGGYFVNGELVLPERLTAGEVTDGVTVVELGEVSAWYGTFEMGVIVDRQGGRLASEQVFARDLGPVVLTLDGFRWELAYYE